MRSHLCGENPIVHIRQKREFILDMAVEGRPCRLEDQEVFQTRSDFEAFVSLEMDFCDAGVFAIPQEGVFVWLSVDGDSSPFVLYDGALCT